VDLSKTFEVMRVTSSNCLYILARFLWKYILLLGTLISFRGAGYLYILAVCIGIR